MVVKICCCITILLLLNIGVVGVVVVYTVTLQVMEDSVRVLNTKMQELIICFTPSLPFTIKVSSSLPSGSVHHYNIMYEAPSREKHSDYSGAKLILAFFKLSHLRVHPL